MKPRSIRALIALLACAAAGCLGDPAPPDGVIKCNPNGNTCPEYYVCARGACYRPDHVPDGGTGSTCAQYCDCIGLSCSMAAGTFKDEGACLTACMKLSAEAFACRTYHCGLAKSDPTTHCPHALGQNTCP